MKLCFLVVLLGVFSPSFSKTRYDGYQVWELTPETQHDLTVLAHLVENTELDFWSFPGHVDVPHQVMIPPGHIVSVAQQVAGMKKVIINSNYQLVVAEEEVRMNARRDAGTLNDFDYADFNTYEAYMAEIERLVDDCPDGVTCSSSVVGQSVEGRDMKLLEISSSASCAAFPTKEVLWLDSLIHAREWLAGATLMSIVNTLVRGYDSDAAARRIVDCFDLAIMPVMNPDGFTYTHTNTRMWRKNRGENAGSSCVGTDLNRNYDYLWGGPGASNNPCSDTYRGDSAASEPETQTTQNEGNRLASRLIAWWTVHTHGYYWLTPFGDCTTPPDNDDIMDVGRETVDAIEATHNSNWRLGNSCQILYATSGSTADWAYATGAKYSYTPELRGDSYGFAPPPSYIPVSYEEIWNGLVAMTRRIEVIEGQ